MKIKTDEVKRIIDEEFVKVAREVRRLTERKVVAVLRTLAEQPIDTETAVQQIEGILKDLLNQGLDNEGLKGILTQIIADIDKGFVGEPLHEQQALGGDVMRLQVELFNSLKELSGPALIQTADMLIADLETLKSQFQ